MDPVKPTSLADRFLVGWTAFIYRHYLAVIVISVIITAFTCVALSRIQISTDVASLLPDRSPAIQGFLKLAETFDAVRVVGVVRSDEDPVTDHIAYLDLVVDLVEADPLVKRTEYRVLDDMPASQILPFLPLLLNEEEFQGLVGKLSTEAIRQQVAVNKRTLVSLPSPAIKELLREDPLMLLTVLLERLGRGRGGFRMDLSQGYFLSEDGRTLLFFLWPTASADDLDFDAQLLERLEAIPGEARDLYVQEGYGEAEDLEGLEIGFTGPHLIAAIESDIIRSEGLRAVGISLVGVLVLFAIAFRRLGSIMYVGAPLVMGVLWSLGFSYLTVGELNLITSGFAAIVLGLGVDFAIHIFNRFLEHRAEDYSTLESLEVAMIETGKGVLTGGLTTAGAFYALTIYDFRGIREFGLITGTGILFCLLTMFTVLPAMLVARSRWWHRFHYRRLASFGMSPLCEQVLRHWRPILVACVAATVILGIATTQITWAGKMGGEKRYLLNRAVGLQREVRETFGGTFKNLVVLLESPDPEVLSRVGLNLQLRYSRFVDGGLLSSVESIWGYLMPPEEQEKRLDSLRSGGVEWERVREDFRAALAAEGFRTEAFLPYEETLRRALTRREAFHLEDLLAMEGIPMMEAFLTRRDGLYTAALYLYPRGEYFVQEDLEAFRASLREGLEGNGPVESFLVGDSVLVQELTHRTRSGFFSVTVMALILVLGILFLHFRKPVRILLALIPLASSVLWLLGSMALLKVQINVMNVAVTPMLLGIGIDDAVHMLNAYLHEGKRDLRRVFALTGKAVALTTLTTCVAFGSLAFADHPGLASMGTLAIWGVSLAFLSTVSFLPVLIVVLKRHID